VTVRKPTSCTIYIKWGCNAFRLVDGSSSGSTSCCTALRDRIFVFRWYIVSYDVVPTIDTTVMVFRIYFRFNIVNIITNLLVMDTSSQLTMHHLHTTVWCLSVTACSSRGRPVLYRLCISCIKLKVTVFKVSDIFTRFWQNLEFSRQIFQTPQYQMSQKSVQWKPHWHAVRRTDEHDEGNKLFSRLCERA
jgi:hypothetical protein